MLKMLVKVSKLFVYLICFQVESGFSQSYEDKRCRCICPSPAEVINNSLSASRRVYTDNVPPNKCNCNSIVLPRIGDDIKGHENEFCPRCECKYEKRNTTIIMVVVVMLVWILTLLTIYMGFVLCLDPLVNKKKVKLYEEHGTEETCKLLTQGDQYED